MERGILSLILLGALLVTAFPGGAISAGSNAPWDFNDHSRAEAVSGEKMPGGEEGFLLRGLRKMLSAVSRVDGDRCPMVPTCTEYSIQSFRDYGFIKGYVMTCDRLMRCGGNTIDRVPFTGTGYFDSPDQNNFWRKNQADTGEDPVGR